MTDLLRARLSELCSLLDQADDCARHVVALVEPSTPTGPDGKSTIRLVAGLRSEAQRIANTLTDAEAQIQRILQAQCEQLRGRAMQARLERRQAISADGDEP